jgi:hypothetical protein
VLDFFDGYLLGDDPEAINASSRGSSTTLKRLVRPVS